MCARLMPYWHKDQSLLIKESGGGTGEVSVTIVVPQWAQGPQRRQLTQAEPALPAPKDDDDDPSVFNACLT